MSEEIVKLLFPEELLEIFEIVSYEKNKDGYVFYLDERLLVPDGYERSDVESKGFHKSIEVSDFPLRGKACLYRIRRRKWLVKRSKKIITRKYKIYANGTRKTGEFAAFLKELDRYYTD